MREIKSQMGSSNLSLHVYAASVRGAICFSQCKPDEKASFELKDLDGEITAFEWGNSSKEIVMGNKNGAVKLYNTELATYTSVIEPVQLPGKGPVVGLGVQDDTIIVGRMDGTINLYDVKEMNNSMSKQTCDHFKVNLADGEASVDVMVHNRQRNVVATGGEKNDLKVFDLAKKVEIFTAKSMGKDKLELPIPTTARGICFHSEGNAWFISTCTKEGMVLLYDERAQRRPVRKYEEPKSSFSCITPYRERQCFVGTTRGYLQLLDMRTAKCVKTMQPFAGAVTGIACHEIEPFVVSTSLDKYLRVHHVDTKQILHKEYLKVALTKLLIRIVAKEEKEEDIDENPSCKTDDKEYDALFEHMETVHDESSDNADGDEDSCKRTSRQKLKKRKKSLAKNAKKTKN